MARVVLTLNQQSLFHAQISAAALVSLGRSPKCPWSSALASVSTFTRQGNLTQYITDHSKVLETDESGAELWETPSGKFWIPRGSAENRHAEKYHHRPGVGVGGDT